MPRNRRLGSYARQIHRGKHLLRAGHLKDALHLFARTADQHPQQFEAAYYAGMVAYQMRELHIAHNFLVPAVKDLAARHDRGEKIPLPNVAWATLFTNLGQLFSDLARDPDPRYSQDAGANAHAALRRALEDYPDHIPALVELGHAAMERGDPEAAATYYARVLRAPQSSPDDDYSRAFVRLLTGDLARGLRDFEHRWDVTSYRAEHLPLRPPDVPIWSGGAVAGTIAIHREQGFGDIMQMLRYLPWVVQQTPATVYVEVHPSLHRLVAHNAPAAVTVLSDGDRPSYDYAVGVLSLPYLAGVRTEADISGAAYWSAPTSACVIPDGVRVGVCWAGGRQTKHDYRRTVPPDAFAPILNRQRCVVLQLDRLEGAPRTLVDLGATDWADTAAVISQLEAVVTVDTAVAHLAGALGVRTHLLLPLLPDHRWQFERADTPWYDSVTLYRQTVPGSWTEPITQIMEAL